MRCLLDTHAFLWAIEVTTHLSQPIRDVIADDANVVFLSVASLWEIAIKVSVGKMNIDHSILDLAISIPARYGYEPLNITPAHLDAVSRLPRHHRDPFDRLLVAQAIVENLPIVSGDAALDAYDIVRIW